MKHLPVYRSKNKCFGAIQLQEQSTKAAKDNLRNELDRMQEREKATQKILRVIGESRADEEPVLDAIVEAAAQLCDANVVGLSLVDETRTRMHYTAVFGAKSDVDRGHGSQPLPSNGKPSNGSTGSTTAACLNQLDTSRQLRQRRHTMQT